MLCPTCNSAISEDSMFCLGCGVLQEAIHNQVIHGFVQVLIKEGTTAYEDNRYEEAIATFKKILEIQPDHAETAKSLSLIEDEYKAIQETLEQARLLLAQRKFGEAQAEARKILKVMPGLREAENIMAQASTNIKRFEEAFSNGKKYLEANKWEEAIEQLRLAIDINPYIKEAFPLKQEAQDQLNAWEQQVARVEGFREAHSFKKAISFAEEMARRRPFDEKLQTLLVDIRKTLQTLEKSRLVGEKALKEGRWREALRAWERVISILPEDTEARHKRDKAAEQDAKARAERVRRVIKFGVLAAIGLVIITIAFIAYSNRRYVKWGKKYLQSGKPDKALKEFEKTGTFLIDTNELAKLKRESLYRIHLLDGNTARTKREWDKAKAAYKKATEFTSDTGEVDALTKLVEAYEALETANKLRRDGKYGDAIETLRGTGELQAVFGRLPRHKHVGAEIEEIINSCRINWLAHAQKLLGSGKYYASSVQLWKIIRKFPRDQETQRLLRNCRNDWLSHAESLREKRKWNEALLEYLRMKTSFFDDKDIEREIRVTKTKRQLLKTRSLFEQEKYQTALRAARECDQWVHDLPQLQKEIADLVAKVNAAIDRKYTGYMVKAKKSLKNGRLKEAKEALKQAILSRKTDEAISLSQEVDDRLAIPEGMVYIPTGPCGIGDSTQQLWKREGPAHKVDVPAFYFDICPVTNAQYLTFVKATGHRKPPHWVKAGNKIPEGKGNHPVVYVSLADARAYASWVNKRLPTEIEWEKAARGPGGWKYPWGDEYKTGMANDDNAGRACTVPVGSFQDGKSFYGCFDMAGNVWEWTNTKFYLYPGSKEKMERGEENLYVIKGGCFMDDKLFLRSSFRETVDPKGSYAVRTTLGFRCAAGVKR